MMTAILTRTSERVVANDLRQDGGYKPELKRTLKFLSDVRDFVRIGFGRDRCLLDVRRRAAELGPGGTLVVPDRGGRPDPGGVGVRAIRGTYPAHGSSYQWASRLANPKVGWLFGWIAIWNLGLSVVAVDNAMASQCLMPLFNMAPSEVVATRYHGGIAGDSGRHHHRVDANCRLDEFVGCRRRTCDRRGAGHRPDRRGSAHRTWLDAQSVLPGHRRPRSDDRLVLGSPKA
jgi:hypothetical protein